MPEDKYRCGISCAHKKDVHDCEKCSPHVGYICAPACKICLLAGRACNCPLDSIDDDETPTVKIKIKFKL